MWYAVLVAPADSCLCVSQQFLLNANETLVAMFRGFFSKSRYGLYYCAYIPGLTKSNAYDQPRDEEELEPKNGIERVFALFQKDQRGELKKEVVSSIQITLGSGTMLAFYGGFKHSKGAFEHWITLHSSTRFRTGYQAKRALHDYVALKFGKYFFIYGLKGALFSGILMFTLVAVSAYRDKNGILEYFIAGILAGSMMRTNYGLKGMFSGAFVGSGLCTLSGLFANLLLRIGNITIDDVRKWQYDITMARKNWYREIENKADADQLSQSFKHYSSRLTQPSHDDEDKDKVFVLINEEKKSVTNDDIRAS